MLPIVLCLIIVICAVDLFRLYKAQSAALPEGSSDSAGPAYSKGPFLRRLSLYGLGVFAVYYFGGWLSYL